MNAGTDEGVKSSQHDAAAAGPGGERGIPWLQVVRFHQAVAVRADPATWQLEDVPVPSTRWSPVADLEPASIAGPWEIPAEAILSADFRQRLELQDAGYLFLAGPYLKARPDGPVPGAPAGAWPLFYLEVNVDRSGDHFVLGARQARWRVTPVLRDRLDALEIRPEMPLDELPELVFRSGIERPAAAAEPLHRRIVAALWSLLPELAEGHPVAEVDASLDRVSRPWGLLSAGWPDRDRPMGPADEYRRVEATLRQDATACGGLRLLEAPPQTRVGPEADVLPLLPLNHSQREAVQRGLRDRALTVITGLPGSGKTQVAAALLLNAWASGRSALLVTAGDQAADVVAQRLQQVGPPAPVAVRAGVGHLASTRELLQRVAQLGDPVSEMDAEECDVQRVLARAAQLREDRTRLVGAIEGDLCSRIQSACEAVIHAHQGARAGLVEFDRQAAALLAERRVLGLDALAPEQVEAALNRTRAWLDRLTEFRELARDDARCRARVEEEIRTQERQRDEAVAALGLPFGDGGDWDWLLAAEGRASLVELEDRLGSLLSAVADALLAPAASREEFHRWSSAERAEAWAGRARGLVASIRAMVEELAAELERRADLHAELDRQRVQIRGWGIPEDFDPNEETLLDWLGAWRDLQRHQPRSGDGWPWSAGRRLLRRLLRLERRLWSVLPDSVQGSVGALDQRGRERLAAVLEAARRWSEIRAEQRQILQRGDPVEARLQALRVAAAELDPAGFSAEEDPESWAGAADRFERDASLADRAAAAWRRREDQERTEEKLRAAACDWLALADGLPLYRAWCQGPGHAFDRAIRALAVQPDREGVARARDALAGGALALLWQAWDRAANHERAARDLRDERSVLPQSSARLQQWWEASPPANLLGTEMPVGDEWPDPVAALEALDRIADWCVRWRFLGQEDEPRARRQVSEDLNRAIATLERLVGQLPSSDSGTDDLRHLLATIQAAPAEATPEPELREACAALNPQALRARIEAIDAELERDAVDHARARWRERLRRDAAGLRAIETCLEGLNGSMERPLAAGVDAEALLRVLPLWIARADDTDHLPFGPECFDLVVVDEAQQCTLTELIPSVFRARSLAVIGDVHLRPPRRVVDAAEEAALGQRLGIDGHLPRLGHARSDLLTAAAWPADQWIVLEGRRRGDPGIVALANRLVYRQRLEAGPEVQAAGAGEAEVGVLAVPVAGTAERGPAGFSWVNESEARRVVELLQDLRQRSPALSLAVLTPFRAQRDRLRAYLHDQGLDVVAHLPADLQGQQRDVIVFTLVAAKGLTAHASHWLQESRRLLHLGLTRASRALIIVADMDYCVESGGFVGDLAAYCHDLVVIRQGNPGAAQVFEGLVLAGLVPKVSPRIADIGVDLAVEEGEGRRLAIEVNGGAARHGVQRDRAREAYLREMGFEYLRTEEGQRPEEVVARVLDKIDPRAELS